MLQAEGGLQLLDTKTDSPEILNSLSTLSTFYDDNSPGGAAAAAC